ncbi:LysE family translocator [Nodosilinea sp. LEGE 07088]|nr:LysE family translocator [Nodosilinea sp. LEGE 07088]
MAKLESPVETIDLADIGPPNWERLCVLSPYSTNENASSTLGFDWDVEGKTGIESRDDVYVLVFVDQGNVLSHVEIPRQERELINSSISCLERADSIIVWSADDGWSVLPAAPRAGLVKIFLQAILTNLLNPKAALFFLAFIPQFIDPAAGPMALQTLRLGVIVAAASSLWLALIAAMVATAGQNLRRHPRVVALQRWITGSLFVGLGLRLAIADSSD